MAEQLSVVGIAGSPSAGSRSTRLISLGLQVAAGRGAQTELIELSTLPAEPLLARCQDPDVSGAVSRAQQADLLVVGTPIYRAAYSGQLKAFFDLFPTDGLVGVAAVLLATGAAPIHQLAIDHCLRPLLASLGALSCASAVYAMDADFSPVGPSEAVAERVRRSVLEGLALAPGLKETRA